jgi:hypothetical protein
MVVGRETRKHGKKKKQWLRLRGIICAILFFFSKNRKKNSNVFYIFQSHCACACTCSSLLLLLVADAALSINPNSDNIISVLVESFCSTRVSLASQLGKTFRHQSKPLKIIERITKKSYSRIVVILTLEEIKFTIATRF